MSSPYRENAAPSVNCPRCGSVMPAGDLAACVDGCGVWIISEAAALMLTASEVKPSRITSWYRERCACPSCGDQMTLRGSDMSLFQGCDKHGFWIDDSTVMSTNLAHPANAPRVAQMRAATKLLRDELARAAAEEAARLAEEPAARAKREAEAARDREEAARKAQRDADERARRQREAKRNRVEELVHRAVDRRDIDGLVDELMRLDDAITSLANRITNGGL